MKAGRTPFRHSLLRLVPLLASGATNAEIARKLGLSKHTVEVYVSEMKSATGSRDRVALALLCQKVVSRMTQSA